MKQVQLDSQVMMVVEIDKMSDRLKKAYNLLVAIQKGLNAVSFTTILFQLIGLAKTLMNLFSCSIWIRNESIFPDSSLYPTTNCLRYYRKLRIP